MRQINLLDQLKLLPQRNQLTRELEEMKRNTPPAQGTTKIRVEKTFQRRQSIAH